MTLPTRHMLLGMTLGALTASIIAVTGPGMVAPALADELLGTSVARGFDTADLIKFEERDYAVTNEDWVSSKPLSSVQVKKIEAGQVSYVTITTTATGTYSTDGMFSRHVQYPGISVEELRPRNQFSYWSNGRWSGFSARAGDSFRYFSNSLGNSGFRIRN